MYVRPSTGGKVPRYIADGGADIHQKIREKMREIVLSEYIPVYLDENAKVMLKDAQVAAKEARLATSSFIMDGEDTYWFTWTGAAKHRALLFLERHTVSESGGLWYCIKIQKNDSLTNPGNLQKNF